MRIEDYKYVLHWYTRVHFLFYYNEESYLVVDKTGDGFDF